MTFPTFQLLKSWARPLFEARFFLPTRLDVDGTLLGGAALFGIGWGIAGLCPGSAIANLAFGTPHVPGFVVAMVAGLWLRDRFANRPHAGPGVQTAPT